MLSGWRPPKAQPPSPHIDDEIDVYGQNFDIFWPTTG